MKRIVHPTVHGEGTEFRSSRYSSRDLPSCAFHRVPYGEASRRVACREPHIGSMTYQSREIRMILKHAIVVSSVLAGLIAADAARSQGVPQGAADGAAAGGAA